MKIIKNQYSFTTILSRLFALFLILNSASVNAESLFYSVMKDNKPIGRIHIERTQKNDLTEYFFESNVKLTFIIGIEVYDRKKVTFKGKQMLQAQLYRTLNGRVRVNNTASWNGSKYQMVNKDHETSYIKHLISLTTANLYYHEPSDATIVFSEKFQKMVPITHVKNRRYLLELPGGNKTYYSYTNGICSMVEAELIGLH
jgi:hypothetical protein